MATKTKLDPRKLMEKAIAVMKESINEPRADGKASPLVGAVLWKPDGPAETAHRGELREGDHAEFTLLERKNRANKLDGCILFATLEPCAPGARNHPKLSCAERIVNTRIKEVWVGIEDPDPTVDRKGIKFLQDHGVTVHIFERDLQEEIQTANKEFIAQALARRAAAEEAGGEVVLSTLENPVATADLRDFSTEALERYRSIAKIGEAVKSEAFQRKLVQQGLMKVEGKKAMPAGFGMLLFGKSPRDVMPQAGLLGTIHWPDGTEEVRDFDGPMVEVPGQAIQWLKDKLPNPISRSGAQRREANEKFYELVREGIVNALVHRNYDVAGAKCQLVVTPDTITIKSPGEPVPPITLKQLQDFNAPMLSRNPVLHYVFAKMELAEERGLGLKSMKSRASDVGLPMPRYAWENPYLVLTRQGCSAGAGNRRFGAIECRRKGDMAGHSCKAAHDQRGGDGRNEFR
jgi:ATP-dependent DNA helicase RecG